jgi:carbonic anhydrase
MKYFLLCFSICLLLCCKSNTMNNRNTALTATEQQARSPEDVFEQLQAGNIRFVNSTPYQVDASALRSETVDGQHPQAVVLSCIDSRVPVEMVFDQHIGDIFVARVAGNFENDDILGSMEYACAVAGSKLVVVLGHAGCGAVKAACDGVELGHITGLLSSIAPAVSKVEGETNKTPTSKDSDFVNAAIAENVRMTMARILEKSSILKELNDAEKIAVVGGVYQLDSGQVIWLD